ncbi:DUF2062 domain-containing protein [Aureivirga sp. CE67]|uniref:DUF2062 domain-containing protein n=1 Tax=Aureivirga sp. CE67 TaxID=1788983 RepID=UPI0018CA8FFF|nr:DUF2062 domain-containing protein [Aureivirga sp. CE67]
MKNPIKLFKSIFKLEDNPEKIAKGFAMGSFIGMMPIPGFQVLVSLAFASLFKLNKKAACVAVFNTNLVTGLFIFSFNYWLGQKVLGIESGFAFPDKLDIHFVSTIFKAGSEVYLSLIVGGIITGIIYAIAAYFLLKNILTKRLKKEFSN